MTKELLTLKELGFTPKNILDVGACILEWTSDCLDVFPESNYVMIDGNDHPKNFHYQDQTYKASIEKRYLVEVLADEIKEVDWYTDARFNEEGKPISYGQGSSIFKEKTNFYTHIKPQKRTTNTLDNLFPDSTFELIKIDTQGSEIPILKGGKELVQRAEVIMLELPFYCEFNENVPSFLEHIQFMDSINFIPKDITQIHQGESDIKNVTLQVDVLFIKKDHPINKISQEAVSSQSPKWFF